MPRRACPDALRLPVVSGDRGVHGRGGGRCATRRWPTPDADPRREQRGATAASRDEHRWMATTASSTRRRRGRRLDGEHRVDCCVQLVVHRPIPGIHRTKCTSHQPLGKKSRRRPCSSALCRPSTDPPRTTPNKTVSIMASVLSQVLVPDARRAREPPRVVRRLQPTVTTMQPSAGRATSSIASVSPPLVRWTTGSVRQADLGLSRLADTHPDQ